MDGGLLASQQDNPQLGKTQMHVICQERYSLGHRNVSYVFQSKFVYVHVTFNYISNAKCTCIDFLISDGSRSSAVVSNTAGFF